MKIENLRLIHISALLLIFDLLALIFLGKAYSKYLIFAFGLYAHDFVLIIITGLCFFEFDWKRNRLYSIEILIILALLYLIVSFVRNDFDFINKGYIILRQYAVFGYLTFFYIITKRLTESLKIEAYIIKSIYFLGIICFVVQLIHIINLYFNTNLLQITERNAYSPIVVMGFFIFTSYILTRKTYTYFVKFLISLFVFILSISIGHDSVYLGLLIIWAAYLFIKSNKNVRIIIASMGVITGILILLYIPSFSDPNAQWRVIFWLDILARSSQGYLIFGEGFGIEYANTETIKTLNDLMLSKGHNVLIIGDEKYLTGPHNSFLSMILHIGILSIFFLLLPLRKLYFKNNLIKDKNFVFLFLSLIGMSVFSFFNVILELPHSSSIFWIVYFVIVFSIKTDIEQVR